MTDTDYGARLTDALIGRRLLPDCMPRAHRGRPMFSFWGTELGFSEDDIHATQAYRIYIDYDENLIITGADIVVEGEIISPCSGFRYENPDRFDYAPLLKWCMEHTGL